MMRQVNPKYILRNYLVQEYLAQEAIEQATQGNCHQIETLIQRLRRPFDE
ncbi:hypothetical protein [Vibrio sp.]